MTENTVNNMDSDATLNNDLIDELQVIAAQPLNEHAEHFERLYDKYAQKLQKQDDPRKGMPGA